MRVRIEPAATADDLAATFALIREYADALQIDLCFQDLERELAELPGAYAPPRAGCCSHGSTISPWAASPCGRSGRTSAK
jgi:hypothetical protein